MSTHTSDFREAPGFSLCREVLGTNPPWERFPVAVTAAESQRAAKLHYHKTWVTPSTFPMLPQDLGSSSIRQSKTVQICIGPKGCSLQAWSHGLAAAASQKRIYSILQDISTDSQGCKPIPHTGSLTGPAPPVSSQKRVESPS